MRLITRLDFDGIVCSVLLRERGVIDRYLFVHPKDVQDGKVEAMADDVVANVPYIPGCGLWFDHHSSEEERLELQKLEFKGSSRTAPSAAQVIWDYYGGVQGFGSRFLPLLWAVNKSDSAELTKEEILNPTGWILLSYLVDPRTGLGRFGQFRLDHQRFMLELIDHCRTKPLAEILELADVKERSLLYFEQQKQFEQMLQKCCQPCDHVLITNLLEQETIYAGNRFLVFALYPEQNVEVRILWGKGKQNVVFAVGHSIINRTCRTNVGSLLLQFGGGGHRKVGTCQVPVDQWQRVQTELVERLRQEG
ncbi:MAG: exopolyphosphatase [Acidobacteria bacterium]|nr:MAG: exopolyphosphatase [Acidobacteriota bacterium]